MESLTNLPTGTVTFLFTDIEGSTELWERHPEAMHTSLQRHDRILREAVEENQGRVFKTVGDAFHAAFDDATAALEAALGAQRKLHAEAWEVPQPVRVRMAIHAGAVEDRDGDYFGPPLNRVARILSAAHGGQILLSEAVERLASDRFPEGIALRDMGERSLKDLAEPQRLYQIVTEDLPQDFPPLRTLDSRPHNLPAQASPLVGRLEELNAVRGLLMRADTRLVTLTGPSGIGKSRLALQVAAEVADEFQHGTFLVDLAVVREAEMLAEAILTTLGAPAERECASAKLLEQHLQERQLLLILDNFEQVLEAAPLVATILGAAPKLTILVTSQAPLRVRGEYEYPVPPLRYPDPRRLPAIEVLDEYEAVALFTARARASIPSFRLDEENAEAVVEIVHQLDGLPLAIELAAARLKLFPPRAMVGRLSRRFEFLKSGSRDLPDRQRTLRGALDWSYNLLSEEEQALFRRLAVFDGGFTIEAAEKICSDDDEDLDVVEIIASLVDKSLVKPSLSEGDEPRFERLRSIRDYSVERLEESGESGKWRRRHAEYFADFAQRLDPDAVRKDLAELLEEADREYENIRLALKWAIVCREAALAVKLSQALPAILFKRGLEDGRRIIDQLEDLYDDLSDLDRALALSLTGRYRQITGDNSPEVIAQFEESLQLFRASGHQLGVARALMNLGNARSRQRAYPEARALFEEALEIYREADHYSISGAFMNLGDLSLGLDDLEAAEEYFGEALAAARRNGNALGEAFATQYLAILAQTRGEIDEAEQFYQDAELIFRRLRTMGGIAWSTYYHGGIARERGELERARILFSEALDLFGRAHYRPGIACALLGMATVDAEEEKTSRAARLFGAAEAIFDTVHMTRATLEDRARGRVEELLSTALGSDAFDRERAAGRALPVEDAITLARCE